MPSSNPERFAGKGLPSAESDAGCRFVWTVDEKPTRRCVTHEYDWRPPYEPMCPGRVTPPEEVTK